MKRPISQASVAAVLLAGLFASGASAQKPGSVEDGIRLALPLQTWGVRMDNPGAVVDTREVKSPRQAYLLSSNSKNGITVSITIERVGQALGPDECRTYLEGRKNSFGSPAGLRFTRIIPYSAYSAGAKAGGSNPPKDVATSEHKAPSPCRCRISP